MMNYYVLGRRPALIRNVKLLLTEFLIDPAYQPSNFTSLKQLNRNIIDEFYTLEANLLFLNLGNNQATFNLYNNGDVCSQASVFQPYSLFGANISSAECQAIQTNLLQKGLKTGIVNVL